MSEEIDWQTLYTRLNESLAKNKRLFADEFAERVIEQQKKRIHQLETELIEAKYQLRQKSPWDGVDPEKFVDGVRTGEL